MTCEDLRQDYTSFALGVAEDPEREEIMGHLARKCPTCSAGVASAMATVSAMSGAVKVTEPPKNLRRRVTALVQKEPKRSWAAIYAPWALTALLSLALIAIGITGRRENADVTMLERALPILHDPTAQTVSFGEAKPAKGRVIVSPGEGVVFIGAGMPSLDEGKTFELWILPKDGSKPVAAGTFRAKADSSAIFVRPGLVGNADGVAVSVEPSGGSTQPTTTPFIVTKL